MKRQLLTFITTALLSAACFSQAKMTESVFTEFESIGPDDFGSSENCRQETITGRAYPPVFLLECRGIGGYRLKELSENQNSARLSIISPNEQEHKIDYFESIGYGTGIERKVEWRVHRKGEQVEPIALIVRFDNVEDLSTLQRTPYFAIIKLSEKAVCITNVVKADQENDIRKLADSSGERPCLEASSRSAQFRKKLEDSVPALIDRLNDENDTIQVFAANALVKVGPKSVQMLEPSLEKIKPCMNRLIAIDVIRRIDRRNEHLKSTLFEIAQGKCGALHGHDVGAVFATFGAATTLVMEIDGGISLAAKLYEEEVGSIAASYAFSDLAEHLSKTKAEGTTLKPEMIRDLKAAIPTLVVVMEKTNLKAVAKDMKELRCSYLPVLQWVRESGIKELQDELDRSLKGRKVECQI